MALAALALLAAAAGSAAQARTIDDCETISAWDAYNKCLAEFGPKRGQRARATPSAEPQAERGPRVWRGRSSRNASFGRRRNGRAFAVFDVGAPVRPARPQRRWR
jgi:hypothetical protein